MTIKCRGWLATPRLLCVGAACAVPVLYARWVRPRLLTWGFHLRPAPGGATRLVIRKRGAGPASGHLAGRPAV